jgi:hypothetical protein
MSDKKKLLLVTVVALAVSAFYVFSNRNRE